MLAVIVGVPDFPLAPLELRRIQEVMISAFWIK